MGGLDYSQVGYVSYMKEPTPQSIPSQPVRLVVATRPGFLTASAVPVLIGLAVAGLTGSIDWITGLLTLLGAVLAHAGANVLNDYYDTRAGCDDANDDRVFPFTGGSRMIQNELLTLESTQRLGWGLLASVVVIGLVLTAVSGPALLAIGIAGLLIGWAYSAPPLRLCARGLGELGVALGFGLLIPLGTCYVQTSMLSAVAMAAGLPFALLITLVLYINQFPDLRADAATGKRNWVVRLGVQRARVGYPLIVAAAYASLAAFIAADILPISAAAGLLALPLHLQGGRGLWHGAATPEALRPAIVLTLNGTMLHGLLLAIGIAAGPMLAAVWPW